MAGYQRITEEQIWGGRSWKHPEDMGEGETKMMNMTNMISAMTRAARSRREELENALSIVAEAKSSSSFQAALSIRESHLIQCTRNNCYYEHILTALDEEIRAIPGQPNGEDGPNVVALKLKVSQWEEKQKAEKILNDALEKRYHNDLKIARGRGGPGPA